MIFNTHSDLVGRHAFLSPSNHSWVNYTEQKLEARYHTVRAAQRGTELHDLAHKAIQLGVKLATSNQSLATYVKDGIRYGMSCEQPLYYSDNCFGTADTISFLRRVLRIHDLKTGITATSERQLEVYAAIFCLEYGINPYEIEIVLRIYQREEMREYRPTPELVESIMIKIVESDHQIEVIKKST